MPRTPLWPRRKPKRRNMRMLRTLRVVGTKTPEKDPSFWAPSPSSWANFSLSSGKPSLAGSGPANEVL